MFPDHVYTVLRSAVVILGFICFVWCLMKMSANWSKYDRAGKAFTMHTTLSAFAMTWGASEALILNSPNGIRSVWFLLALGNLLAGLWWTRGASFYANRRDNVSEWGLTSRRGRDGTHRPR